MRRSAGLIISFYQVVISRFFTLVLGQACRFNPTCSQYAKEAVYKHGLIKGGLLLVKRTARCHPFNHGDYDPVP